MIILEIQKLVTFVNLATTLNFSQTAEQLYITQSSVSKHLKALEKELQVPLFERTSRKVTLSEYGKLMLPYAQKILNDYQGMTTALTNYTNATINNISLAAIPTLTSYQAFTAITEYMQTFPEVKLKLEETETSLIPKRLLGGQNDFAFTRVFDQIDPVFDSIVTETDHFAVFVSEHNPLSELHQISLEDLRDEKFVLLAEKTNLFTPIIRHCQNHGFSPNVIYRGERVSSIIDMVQSNIGITILMSKSVPVDKPGIVALPLIDALDSHLVFLKRAHDKYTPQQLSFWNYLQKYFDSKQE